jgi:hypothetical protein
MVTRDRSATSVTVSSPSVSRISKVSLHDIVANGSPALLIEGSLALVVQCRTLRSAPRAPAGISQDG